jgi:PAS domain S-box-containing protein
MWNPLGFFKGLLAPKSGDSAPASKNMLISGQSAGHAELFVSAATEGCMLLDADLNILLINPSLLNLMKKKAGLAARDLIGRNATEVIPGLKESGRHDLYLKTIQTGKSFLLEDMVTHRTFGNTHISVRGFKAGTGLGLIINDITDRKDSEAMLRESEDKFRRVVEESSDGIVLTDEAGFVIEWNRGMESISGLDRSRMLGQPLWDVEFQIGMHGQRTTEKYDTVRNCIRGFLKTGEMPCGDKLTEWNIVRPNGEVRVTEMMSYGVGSGAGRLLATVIRDITERRSVQDTAEPAS